MTGSSALATTVNPRPGSARVAAQWSRVRSSDTPRVYSREAFISTTQPACVSRAIGPSTISSTSSTARRACRVCDSAIATPSRMLDPPALKATGPAVDSAAASMVAAVLLPLVALTSAVGMPWERTEIVAGWTFMATLPPMAVPSPKSARRDTRAAVRAAKDGHSSACTPGRGRGAPRGRLHRSVISYGRETDRAGGPAAGCRRTTLRRQGTGPAAPDRPALRRGAAPRGDRAPALPRAAVPGVAVRARRAHRLVAGARRPDVPARLPPGRHAARRARAGAGRRRTPRAARRARPGRPRARHPQPAQPAPRRAAVVERAGRPRRPPPRRHPAQVPRDGALLPLARADLPRLLLLLLPVGPVRR